KNNLANIFTLGNLFSGTIGVINLVEGNYKITALCIIISLVLDFCDGFVARALKSTSSLGAQLDSLADMVSFGVLPGIVMYKSLEPFGNQLFGINLPFELKYFGLLIALFSCLRLAIFNLDEDQKYYFKGLNTPANTILIFGLYYPFREQRTFNFIFDNVAILLLLSVVSALLLVSPIKMIAMKFKSMKWQENISKITLVVGSVLLLISLKTIGIPLVILYYILVSLLFQKSLK
ncbi:MAG: CDP-alcohol phosphatidyltransferase family protein, partial [Chryseobacterium sp.]|nr:CDP-alcohol phosphatidyltransferase family protein [Chryseobacterium sp.]